MRKILLFGSIVLVFCILCFMLCACVDENSKEPIGIFSIEKTSSEGLTDTYTITLTNGNKTTFNVVNGENGEAGTDGKNGNDGVGIASVEKTSSEGLIDTYTITLTNEEKVTFSITNGEKGENGEGISKAGIINGELIIIYDDGTSQNLGKITADSISSPESERGTYGLEYYTLQDNTYGVASGTTKYLEKIEIPEFYNGKPVSMIIKGAFEDAKNLKSITIPNSVVSIEADAFKNCTSLTNVTISDGITYLSDTAFSGCTSLKYNEFENAYCLGNDKNPCLVIKEIIDKNITSYVINEQTKIIGPGAFYGCSFLENIKISDNVTSIGANAFAECKSLNSVIIGKNVSSISSEAFFGCYRLVEVYNLSSLNITVGSSDNGDVGYYAKVIHTSLDEPSILETTSDGYVFAYVSDSEIYLIDYVGDATELTLPDSYNGNDYQIYENAFVGSDIISVIISEGVTSIGDYAFSCVHSLTSVIIPNTVTSMGSAVFEFCDSLVIYCKAQTKPSGWSENWDDKGYNNHSGYPMVVWGYTGE